MSAKRSPVRRTPWADMRWEVRCTDCPPSHLSRHTDELGAAAAAAAHEGMRPGHVSTYRHTNQEASP